jgi:ferrous iron transport protein A
MNTRPLSQLKPDEGGIIVRVGGSGEIRRRLLDMGVVAGSEVSVERVAPLGDPVQIRVKGYDLALRKTEAEKITIDMTTGPLNGMENGESVMVTAVRAGWGLQRRLGDMGITPGTTVKVVSGGATGQTVIEVKGSRLALGHGVAEKIIVKKVPGEANA